MNYRLVVRPEVDRDLREAEVWYEEQQTGLGIRFLRSVREAICSLPANPFRHPVRHSLLRVRWCYSRPFPYRIVYEVIEDTIVIYCVLHTSRHERHWQKRLGP